VKETPIVGSQLWGAFPSDHIPKVMKDVSVHFFIPRDELTVDNALTVKKNFQSYLSCVPDFLLQ
jgi:hypothetical protein